MNSVRPYKDVTFEIRGARRRGERRVYHPMTHLDDGVGIICGFDDFDGTEPDGSAGPGLSYRECEDCPKIADHHIEAERYAFDDFIDSLHPHETEEQMR